MIAMTPVPAMLLLLGFQNSHTRALCSSFAPGILSGMDFQKCRPVSPLSQLRTRSSQEQRSKSRSNVALQPVFCIQMSTIKVLSTGFHAYLMS